uniref:Transposase Tc1-like domain-containing protein n=1 Tax=Cyprinus carpio carpio TaxID=630221 RepID=A0A9J7ZH27_CYPCA
MRIVKQNLFKNLSELHKEWTEAGVTASRAITHRCVKEFGYSCRIPLVKPLLKHRQRQRCLTWAKEKKNWTVAQWSKVLFSDESKFCISFGNQGPRVWRKGPLCFLKTKVTVYKEILEHFMLPSADQLFEDADFIFQQDLAPAHTAKSTKSWLNDCEILREHLVSCILYLVSRDIVPQSEVLNLILADVTCLSKHYVMELVMLVWQVFSRLLIVSLLQNVIYM